MNQREMFLQLEEARALRNVCWADASPDGMTVKVDKPELRASTDGNTLTFFGHASVTEYEYNVYGGPPYGWKETIARGAFKRTLLNNADVNFLINHEGLSLARTKSGTLTLEEDGTGLRVMAELDPRSTIVADLQSAIARGDIDEMSFAGRFVGSEWTDDDGEPASPMTGTNRRVLEISLNKGDVSSVNYGANPATSGGFRELDRAFAEMRAGKALTEEQRSLVATFAEAIHATEAEVPHEIDGYDRLWSALKISA